MEVLTHNATPAPSEYTIAPDIDPEQIEAVRILCGQAYENINGLSVEPLPNGGNNQLFVISPTAEATTSKKVVAKLYNPDSFARSSRDLWEEMRGSLLNDLAAMPEPEVPRGRQRIEDEALCYLEQLGMTHVPRLLAHDTHAGVSVHSFVEGTQKPAAAFTDRDMRAAIDFVTGLQQFSFTSATDFTGQVVFELADAPPRRHTFRKHLALTRERLGSVTDELAAHETALSAYSSIPAYSFPSPLPEQMITYLHDNEIFARCAEYDTELRNLYQAQLKTFVPREQFRLCHEDLGPHNMLFAEDGALNVVDFELFGWNDPAYAVASMLCHNRMLGLPPAVHEEALAYYEETAPIPSSLMARVRPLLAFGHLEWVARCIDSVRDTRVSQRQHGDSNFDLEQYTQLQIENVEQHFALLEKLLAA